MRTTIDLPADLHQQAMALARDNQQTLSATVVTLLRRAFGESQNTSGETVEVSEATGLPLVTGLRLITTDDVRSLEDDE